MESKKRNMAVGQAAQLEKLVKQAFLAVVIGVILLILSLVANFMMSAVQSEQLEVTMALNQYKNGSKTLTSEVQSYAVTGSQVYYDNYINELNVEQNREKAIAILEKTDITAEEWAKLDEVAALSEGLVPLEEAAMASVGSGDLAAAQESVFGETYEATIVKISAQTDEVITQIQNRKAKQKSMFQLLQIVSLAVFVISCGYIVYVTQRSCSRRICWACIGCR